MSLCGAFKRANDRRMGTNKNLDTMEQIYSELFILVALNGIQIFLSRCIVWMVEPQLEETLLSKIAFLVSQLCPNDIYLFFSINGQTTAANEHEEEECQPHKVDSYKNSQK